MPRAPIVFCTIAFLCAGVLAYLRFESEKAKAALDAQLAAETIRASRLAGELATTREERTALTSAVSRLEADVGAGKASLAASQTRIAQLERELTQAKATTAVHESNARALTAEVAALRQDLSAARAAETSPEKVAAYKSAIAELERRLATATGGTVATGAGDGPAATAVFSRRSMVATVLSVGPENAFVVLNFGTERGAQSGQRLNIVQGTEPVAMVHISEVRPSFSIGQVLPESLRGVLQKGDAAILLP